MVLDNYVASGWAVEASILCKGVGLLISLHAHVRGHVNAFHCTIGGFYFREQFFLELHVTQWAFGADPAVNCPFLGFSCCTEVHQRRVREDNDFPC